MLYGATMEVKKTELTQRQKEVKEVIGDVITNDLRELYETYRVGGHKQNGGVNLATIQKIRKRINVKLRNLERMGLN